MSVVPLEVRNSIWIRGFYRLNVFGSRRIGGVRPSLFIANNAPYYMYIIPLGEIVTMTCFMAHCYTMAALMIPLMYQGFLFTQYAWIIVCDT